jgi:NTE family protein
MRPITHIGSHATRARRGGRPLTAFVLAGGASLGALQVGMLRALYEHGVVPDLLVATSAGALNAAFIASRRQTPDTARELARIWRELQRDDVFPVSARMLIAGLLGKRDHVVSDAALRALVARHVQFDELADAPIPLHVVAFDLAGGGEVRLSAGSTVDAVVGAAAIPGVLPSVRFGDRRLIDGGVVNNTPISHAVELGAERVYVLSTGGPSFVPGRAPAGALGAAVEGLGLLVGRRLASDLAHYASQVELIVLPAPNPLAVQPTDFDHASRLMRDALAAARLRLAQPLDTPVEGLRAAG